ncbi:MAG: fluoride efflux transporter CrcB [Burkholderiales bacterium]|nr:fluoride efflux transporter CrcB [Burkholderiales bacterium]MCW5576238.1 fluoride efflux transporter CrcB [Burkholderiales bacterium]MCW5604522.1 fluoride efflux transporter CrcB [Burkholderiales bacterium]
MNASNVIAVAFGGAIGSVARYLVGVGSTKLLGFGFPWGTLLINITGSCLLGIIVAVFAIRWNPSQAVQLFLTVGICGGYTTFSTFSLDSQVLMQRGDLWSAAAYIAASVVLSIGALFAGMHLARTVL